MKRKLLALGIAVGLGWAIFPTHGYGQAPPLGAGVFGPRPAVSPYLNLTRGGLPAVNYFGLVRPQIETQQALQNLQQQIQLGVNPLVNPGANPQVLTTGHSATFNNLSHYYPVGGYPPRPPRFAGR